MLNVSEVDVSEENGLERDIQPPPSKKLKLLSQTKEQAKSLLEDTTHPHSKQKNRTSTSVNQESEVTVATVYQPACPFASKGCSFLVDPVPFGEGNLVVASRQLEMHVEAIHGNKEEKTDKKSQLYKALVEPRSFDQAIDNNLDEFHECRFLSIPKDPVLLGKAIPVVITPLNPTPDLRHLHIHCVPEALITKMHDRRNHDWRLKQFSRDNLRASKETRDKKLMQSGDGTMSMTDSLLKLSSIKESVMAGYNYAGIWMNIHIWDFSPFAFLRWVVFHSFSNPALKPEHIEAWFSTFVFQAAQKAIGGKEPLAYDDMKKFLEEDHHDTVFTRVSDVKREIKATVKEEVQGVYFQANPQRGGGRGRGPRGGWWGQGAAFRGGYRAPAPVSRDVCFGFQKGSCSNSQANGGCTTKSGKFLAHRCSAKKKDGTRCDSLGHGSDSH